MFVYGTAIRSHASNQSRRRSSGLNNARGSSTASIDLSTSGTAVVPGIRNFRFFPPPSSTIQLCFLVLCVSLFIQKPFPSFQVQSGKETLPYKARGQLSPQRNFSTSTCTSMPPYTICLTTLTLFLGHQSSLILPLTNPPPTTTQYTSTTSTHSVHRTRKNKPHTYSASGGPSLRLAGQCVCPWIKVLARARQLIPSHPVHPLPQSDQ